VAKAPTRREPHKSVHFRTTPKLSGMISPCAGVRLRGEVADETAKGFC